MTLAIASILIPVAAGYITTIPCRSAESRKRPAAWYYAFFGIIGAGLLTVLFVYQGDLFRPSAWDRGNVPMSFLVPFCFVVSCAVVAIPALLVVHHYRRRFRNAHAAA